MRPRPELHETEAETKTRYRKTEIENKKVVLRPSHPWHTHGYK